MLSTISAKLGFSSAALTLIYFIIYAAVCPSKELVTAVVVEVSIFLAVVVLQITKRVRTSREAQEVVLDELSNQTVLTRNSWKFAKSFAACLMAIAVFVLLFDLSCLGLTCAGMLKPAEQLYLMNPLYRIPGVHPALSAELLAGAYLEADHPEPAEQISGMLLEIRDKIYGNHHPMIAEMYNSFANIYLHKKQPQIAERYCRLGISLWRNTVGIYHLGDAYTKLGNALRDQGRFAEAESIYAEALSLREKEFGPRSEKVLKTLNELHSCLLTSNQVLLAQAVAERIKAIRQDQLKESKEAQWFMPIYLLGSFGLSWILFGHNGCLTNLVLTRLDRRVRAAGDHADPKDIRKIISLLKHKNQRAQVQRYEALLLQVDDEAGIPQP